MKYKDKSVEEIVSTIIITNNFDKSFINLKNVVLLMDFEKEEIIKQKTKKYFIPNLIYNIREQIKYQKKIQTVIDNVITSFNYSRKEFLEKIKSEK